MENTQVKLQALFPKNLRKLNNLDACKITTFSAACKLRTIPNCSCIVSVSNVRIIIQNSTDNAALDLAGVHESETHRK